MNKAIGDFEKFEQDGITLYCGDNREILPLLEQDSIDSCITDPPYEFGFMGLSWDSSGIAYDKSMWGKVLGILKPGAHCLAFGGSRTYHRMACAVEDAGFEIRDQIMWVHGQGFPKSLDVSKAIDKSVGAKRTVVGTRALQGKAKTLKGGNFGGSAEGKTHTEVFEVTEPTTDDAKKWSGWGTALKPANEPIVVARKGFDDTVANNMLQHGTGGINIDACRVPTNGEVYAINVTESWTGFGQVEKPKYVAKTNQRYNPPAGNKPGGNSLNMSKVGMPEGATGTFVDGRWPANFIHDGSDEVLEGFPDSKSCNSPSNAKPESKFRPGQGNYQSQGKIYPGDFGSAARFFYCAKVSNKERGEGNKHATLKPVALMRYLCKLVTQPGGTVIDPFMGAGSTGIACVLEGFKFIGIEKDKESFETAKRRIQEALSNRVQTLEDYFVE